MSHHGPAVGAGGSGGGGGMLWNTVNPNDEWFCYMIVTTDSGSSEDDNDDLFDDGGMSAFPLATAHHQAHQQDVQVLCTRMRDSVSAGDMSHFKQKYAFRPYRGDADTDKHESDPTATATATTRTTMSEHEVVRRMTLNCAKRFGIPIDRDQVPKRTVLGCSQYPFDDLIQYNQHGPTRSSVTSMGPGGEIGGGGGGGGTSSSGVTHHHHHHHHHRFTGPIMKRKPRSRKKRPLCYKMALIISGFGTDMNRAKRFYHMWNERSRGPVPRAAKGAYQATLWSLKIFGNWNAIFNCSFTYYTVECDDGKMIFSLRREFAKDYPSPYRYSSAPQVDAAANDDDDAGDCHSNCNKSKRSAATRKNRKRKHSANHFQVKNSVETSEGDTSEDFVDLSEQRKKRQKRHHTVPASSAAAIDAVAVK